MKTVKKGARAKTLPRHHVAILFEGPWLLTQDPDDPMRVLAICPYTNDPDHICQRGLWEPVSDALVGMTLTEDGLPVSKSSPGLVREGEQFWVDVAGRSKGTPPKSVATLFRSAAAECLKYPFVFLEDTVNQIPMDINHANRLMRRVSIAMPDYVKPTARIKNSSVQPGVAASFVVNSTDYMYKAGASTEFCSYVAFAFVYDLQQTGSLTVHSPSLPPSGPISVPLSSGYNPHLIFRVRGGNVAEADGCPPDTSGDNRHVVASFDLLRKLVIKPYYDGLAACHIDVGIYPPSVPIDPDATDHDFSAAELGIAKEGQGGKARNPIIKDLASCAAGPIFGNGGDGSGGDGGGVGSLIRKQVKKQK